LSRNTDCYYTTTSSSFHTNVDERRLVAERAKFATKHVMVSAGVCFSGKGRLYFIPDKTKVNAKLYVKTLLTELVQYIADLFCHMASSFKDGVPAHTAKLAQDWTALQLAVDYSVQN